MRHGVRLLGAVALIAPLALAGAAHAANEFVVIPGIGPSPNARPVQSAAPPSAPAPQTRGALGGGLLEFLVTGRDPSAPPPAPVAAVEPAPAQAPTTYIEVASVAPQEPTSAEVESEPEEVYRRHEVAYAGGERPGTIVSTRRTSSSILVEPGGPRAALRHRRRPAGLRMVGREDGHAQGGMAGLDAADRDDAAPARPAEPYGGRRPTIRSARARSISAPRSTASTAPTSPRRSARTSRPAASG